MTTEIIRQQTGLLLFKRKARKEHSCRVCSKPIHKGTDYYVRLVAGSGVGGMIDADKIHLFCI